MQKLLKEPLFHFLMLGGLLFVLYGWVNKGETAPEDYEIIIQDTDIERLVQTYQRSWKAAPDSMILRRLLEEELKSEIFYREALRMNLEHNDEIIRRRLKQKYEFLIKDLVTSQEPTEDVLKVYYQENLSTYQTEQQYSFHQYYFSPDKRKEPMKDALDTWKLGDEAGFENIVKKVSDNFHLQTFFAAKDYAAVNQTFGKTFADGLFEVAEAGWTKPIQSGYGVHLVNITKIEKPQQIPFEQCKQRVLDNFKQKELEVYNEALFEGLKDQYEVVYDLDKWKKVVE